MPISTYAGNAIINQLVRGVAMDTPARVFVSIHTANPGDAGASEVTVAAWPSYVRQDPAQGGAASGGFSTSIAKATENLLILLFSSYDGGAALTVTHFGIWDALTGGNLLWYGALTVSKTLQPSDEVIVYPGDLDLSVN